MKVLIRNYRIAHEGVLYNPGDVLDIEDSLAEQLIFDNEGDFVEYKPVDTEAIPEEPTGPTEPAGPTEPTDPIDPNADDFDVMELPDADIEDSVKGGKK